MLMAQFHGHVSGVCESGDHSRHVTDTSERTFGKKDKRTLFLSFFGGGAFV